MAGDWIKMKGNLLACPKFYEVAGDYSDAQALLALYKLACWFNVHHRDGFLKCSPAVIDAISGLPGIADRLLVVGWLGKNHQGSFYMIAGGFCTENYHRKGFSARFREMFLKGAKCKLCGGTERLEIDHVIPVSKGGTHDAGNLQPLCEKCNRRKGRKEKG